MCLQDLILTIVLVYTWDPLNFILNWSNLEINYLMVVVCYKLFFKINIVVIFLCIYTSVYVCIYFATSVCVFAGMKRTRDDPVVSSSPLKKPSGSSHRKSLVFIFISLFVFEKFGGDFELFFVLYISVCHNLFWQCYFYLMVKRTSRNWRWRWRNCYWFWTENDHYRWCFIFYKGSETNVSRGEKISGVSWHHGWLQGQAVLYKFPYECFRVTVLYRLSYIHLFLAVLILMESSEGWKNYSEDMIV